MLNKRSGLLIQITILEELRFVKGGQVHHNETWHWNNAVNDVVKKKQSNGSSGN